MKEWMSLKTVAKEYADLSERTLRGYLGHPERPLPARYVGGKLLIPRAELEMWLRSFPRRGEDIDRIVEGMLENLKDKQP